MSSRRFHIILDCDNVPVNKLKSEAFLIELMGEIKDAIDMKFLVWPQIAQGTVENPGLTAFAIIDFSHISIHTFTETGELCLDVFSCKKFDYRALYDLVKEALRIKDSDIKRAVVTYNSKPKL